MDGSPTQAGVGQVDLNLHNRNTNLDGRSQSPMETSNNNSKTGTQPRQKRKKARRACLACQRAHLTCGDERPCHRCIKRGLEAECHDGMRKKAKYLLDAPNEALIPGAEQSYKFSNNQNSSPSHQRNDISENGSTVQQSQIVHPGRSMDLNSYPQDLTTSQDIANQLQNPLAFSPYGSQQSPVQNHIVSQPQMLTSMQPVLDNAAFGTQNFDLADPIFNFDVSGMNFSNNYGAMELGMLNHMSSNANDGLLHCNSSSIQESPSVHSPTYIGDSPEANNYLINPRYSIQDWPGAAPAQVSDRWVSLQNRPAQLPQQAGFMDPSLGYSLGHIPSSISSASPPSNSTDLLQLYDKQIPAAGSVSAPQRTPTTRRRQSQAPTRTQSQQEPPQRGQGGPSPAISKKLEHLPSQAVGDRPTRDPSTIYSTVTKPYPYTLGFHALTAMLHHRFSSQKRLRIAQALASIRPSFISCMRTLTNEDLIFMEKCFQRQLWEYQDFISACGTPTLVCRRTGEVAYAAKEFSALTGWSGSILLGLEPNLNVNKKYSDGSQSGTMSNSSRGGMNTPLVPIENIKLDSDRPQPVLLPELLDDDSVVDFYEDFAKLAFADSKGSTCKPCKLVKYRTKENQFVRKGFYGDDSSQVEVQMRKVPDSPSAKLNRSKPRIGTGNTRDQSDIYKLGEKEGKIDCMYCWTVKRDVFEVPMMIVLNFLPVL